jgi:heme-degrading monooxygenase HmoA
MFARRVSMHLKPNCASDFTKRLEKEVIPLLRKQNGFQDEMSFITTGGKEAFGISLWDRKESAEAYSRATYPQVAKILTNVVEGTPQVDTFEVSNSTFHKIAAAVTV